MFPYFCTAKLVIKLLRTHIYLDERWYQVFYYYGRQSALSVEKVMNYGLGEQTMRWTENGLNGQAQRVGVSSAKSSGRPETSGVHQG